MNTFEITYKNGEVRTYSIKGAWLIKDGFVQFTEKDSTVIQLCISADIIGKIELTGQETGV